MKKFTFFILHFTFITPAHAKVEIRDEFGFSQFASFASATSELIPALFSIATFLVILYFLLGAFKFLKAGGNKEEIEGARQMITQSIVGFLILMVSFFVIQFLLYSLFKIEFSLFQK